MEAKSAIAKGKRFEKKICEMIEQYGFGQARRAAGSGNGNRDKGDIVANIPFLIEAKNHKKLNWWDSITQAREQAKKGNWDSDKWALVVRDPRTSEENPEIYAVIDFGQFMELLKKDAEPRVKEPDRQLKWSLNRLRQCCKEVMGQIE